MNSFGCLLWETFHFKGSVGLCESGEEGLRGLQWARSTAVGQWIPAVCSSKYHIRTHFQPPKDRIKYSELTFQEWLVFPFLPEKGLGQIHRVERRKDTPS